MSADGKAQAATTMPFLLVLLLNCLMVLASWTQGWQVVHHPSISLLTVIITVD